MSAILRAPFPWFGGKSRVAPIVWDRFGDCRNYVEPFAGSLAVLLGRPSEPKVETVNDLDCYLANFWRALQHDPDQVAHYADSPVNEADLHARHRWLVATGAERVDRLRTDPEYFDAKVAGWWVWGQCLWIGSGWCKPVGVAHANGTRRELDWAQRPDLSAANGRGMQTSQQRMRADRNGGRTGVLTANKRPRTPKGGSTGVHQLWEKRPELKRGGKGVHRTVEQMPASPGNTTSAGPGVLSDAAKFWDGRGNAARNARGVQTELGGGVHGYLNALSDRLRRVRVCCGDWSRILGPAVTTCIGRTAVFLDPPYHDPGKGRSRVYNHDEAQLFEAVLAWAVENGDNPQLRIALCGYEGAHTFPAGWIEVPWKASGGYGNSDKGRANRNRERIWFSPHCLSPDQHQLAGIL